MEVNSLALTPAAIASESHGSHLEIVGKLPEDNDYLGYEIAQGQPSERYANGWQPSNATFVLVIVHYLQIQHSHE